MNGFQVQQGAETSRPNRWMSGIEENRLSKAVGGGRELNRCNRLLHIMLLEENKRSQLSDVIEGARELLLDLE